MAKNLEIPYLLDFYGEMLTKKQRDFLSYYYEDDLSLSEIAVNEGITRQGVRDAVKRAESQLMDMENKLGFGKYFAELKNSLKEIADCADDINEYNFAHTLSREVNDKVARIKSLVEYLSE